MAFKYAVKFVCGTSEGKVVAPGEYWTAINVHNPTDGEISFSKKFAIALPGEEPGPVTEFIGANLGPDQALEIDRDNIWKHTGVDPSEFLKGFVVIDSDVELDVVAVYSVISEATGNAPMSASVESEQPMYTVISEARGIALHIERVAPSIV